MKSTKDAPSKRFAFKEWLTLTLSVLAFFISGGIAYFNVVRQEDHVRLIFYVNAMPSRIGMDTLSISSDVSTAVFINSGNRPVVIMSAYISFFQPVPGKPQKCTEAPAGSAPFFSTDFEPIVLKENEAVAKKITIINASYYNSYRINKEGDKKYTFSIVKENQNKDQFPMEVCLLTMLATPSAYHQRTLLVSRLDVTPHGTNLEYTSNIDSDWRKPQILIQEFRTIFGR